MVPKPEKKGRNANISVKIEENWEPDSAVPPIENEYEDAEPPEGTVERRSTKDIVAELCKQRAIPSVLELQLQEYFQQHSSIHPLPASESNTVDIDLADPDEETWIIQCPTTIDVKAELTAKKINLEAGHSTIRHCTVPLEAHVQLNSEERVIGLLSGTRVKSFVPAGFVRINQALPSLTVPVPSSNGDNITVPYPEEIRERHPLLGYDFNEHMSLPKHVRKQLSFAQQKAALMYKNVGKTKPASKKKSHATVQDTAVAAADGQQNVSLKKESVAQSTSTQTKKRKQPPEQEVVVVPVTVKQEPQSPKRKKGKKDDEVQTVAVKKEVTVEDDISWLLNI